MDHSQPSSTLPNPQPEPGHQEPWSKSALKKLEKEKEKSKKKQQRQEQLAKEQAGRNDPNRPGPGPGRDDYGSQNFGKLVLNQSQHRQSLTWSKIDSIKPDMVGQTVRIRARVHNSRSQSTKLCFLVLRQQISTIQAILSVDSVSVSKQMVKFGVGIPLESIVTIEGVLKKPVESIKTCSISEVEIKLNQVFLSDEAPMKLPFSLEDASRPPDAIPKDGEHFVTVGQDTRLDNRVLDLRTPVNQSIFRVQSKVCNAFRSFLDHRGFVEIHTPKIQASATESGSSVFKLQYFDQFAYLAQSPQLAKQMAIAADFDRVYEIGPVFRAENSNTYRHMTEFTGLDLEMTIQEHYEEVIELIDEMFISIFKTLNSSCSKEIEIIRSQFHQVDEFKFLRKNGEEKTLKLNHRDAVQLLRDNGHQIEIDEDMGTEQERELGKLIKAKYDTDYYIIDKFPLAIRPFYTMPDPNDPTLSNSYDFFMRGEEIISGAQRINSPDLLIKRMKEVNIKEDEMKSYLNAFKLSCQSHGGCGIGLERLVMLFFGLGNIRRASLFPRDPKRLEP